ncbi:MAG: hypothetical protein RMJ28_04845 [Nitrososphaerota archaeon]|nr:hypothetical protein [Candidatus Calditenuaceae archaeon]MDW8073547.1 hypothetical protein [Nitrososphaerota archaeon]
MKKQRLFKCTNCGHEARLQAWKAECPSCRSGFTLVLVEEKESWTRPRLLGYVPPALASFYLLLTLLYPGMTVARLLPWPAAQIVLIAVAIFSLTSSTLGNLVAAAAGAALSAAHLAMLGLSTLGELGSALTLIGLTASSVVNEASIRRAKPRG